MNQQQSIFQRESMKSGDTFGGCRILCESGTGAYGTIYLAKDALERTVALKVFHTKWNTTHKLDGLRKYISSFTLFIGTSPEISGMA